MEVDYSVLQVKVCMREEEIIQVEEWRRKYKLGQFYVRGTFSNIFESLFSERSGKGAALFGM